MYCSNCGKELTPEAKYCPECGANRNGEGKIKALARSVEVEKGRQYIMRIIERIKNLDTVKMPYLRGLVCLVIGMLLLNREVYNVTYTVFGTREQSFSMFEGVAFVKICFYIAYLAGICGMVLPLVTGMQWQEKNFRPAQLTPLLTLSWMLTARLVVASKIKSRVGRELMSYVDIKIKLSAAGWLILIFAVATFFAVREAKNRMEEAEI